jgi:hypothetical protein
MVVCIVSLHGSTTAYAQRGRYQTQLAAECDELIDAAVRRPYGWAWDTVSPAAPTGRAAPRHVMMEPLGTPAAGIVLLWSGQLLDEARFRQAALQAARGVAASQATSGKVAQRALFGSSGASPRDQPAVVPERAATAAGFGLLIALIESEEPKPDSVPRAAIRAARWLAEQQAADGGWVTAHPSDSASPRHSSRFIRLDTPDYRDCTFALLLSAEAFNDPPLSKSAGRAVSKLLSLRLGTRHVDPAEDLRVLPTTHETAASTILDERASTRPATTTPESFTPPAREAAAPPIFEAANAAGLGNLWSTMYRANGSIDPTLTEYPAGADVPASRHAMQTLLGAYLTTGEKQAGLALDAAAKSLAELRDRDRTWRRVYLLDPTAQPPTTQALGNVFQPPQPIRGPWEVGTFGVEPTLQAVKQLKFLGRDKYTHMLGGQFTVKQHLQAAICGLCDDPLTLELPVSKEEIELYLKSHATEFATLNGPVPQDLAGRLRRLWLLLIRAKLEQMNATR